MCTFAPLLAPCFPLLPRGPTPSVCPSLVPCLTLISFLFGCPPGRALRCSRAPCVCPLLFSVLPLSRRPVPPPTPVSPPIRRLYAGPACFSPTALSAFAALSLVCATRALPPCPSLSSLPCPLVAHLPLCFSLGPCLSPLPGCHGSLYRGGGGLLADGTVALLVDGLDTGRWDSTTAISLTLPAQVKSSPQWPPWHS